MWQPSALQPPCPSSRSKSQYAAVGSTPSAKCLRAIVTECTTLPRLQPSATTTTKKKARDIQRVKPGGKVCERAGSGTHACTTRSQRGAERVRATAAGGQWRRSGGSATSLLQLLHLLGLNAAQHTHKKRSLPICSGNAHITRICHFNMLRIDCVCARVCMRASMRR